MGSYRYVLNNTIKTAEGSYAALQQISTMVASINNASFSGIFDHARDNAAFLHAALSNC